MAGLWIFLAFSKSFLNGYVLPFHNKKILYIFSTFSTTKNTSEILMPEVKTDHSKSKVLPVAKKRMETEMKM